MARPNLSTASRRLEAGASAESVADTLRRAVLAHRVAPGVKLSEEEVGNALGVGRTIVREALRTLAHEHLVEIHRNRGAFVVRPDKREAIEIFEARSLLEPRTARSAAERAVYADVSDLRRHLTEESEAMAVGDSGRAVYLSGQFHVQVARIANQITIARFIESLVLRSSLIVALYWRRPSAMCECHAHEALVDAMAAGDGARAEEIMRGHLVDLLSGLDLAERPRSDVSLAAALKGL
ncbi:MAG: GntR family transcriptional regulator [Pseudomonadota bacterium]